MDLRDGGWSRLESSAADSKCPSSFSKVDLCRANQNFHWNVELIPMQEPFLLKWLPPWDLFQFPNDEKNPSLPIFASSELVQSIWNHDD